MITTTTNTFFYSGISFPPRKQGNVGFWATATDQELIRESIYALLNTRKGEMPMSDFGTSMDSSLFDAANQAMMGVLCQQIKQDIQNWEPRVTVNTISAYSYENILMFNIELALVLTGQQFSIQVPFNQ